MSWRRLQQLIAEADREQAPPPLQALTEDLVQQSKGTIAAVVFYGSCRRAGSLGEGIADLYLLVDSYEAYFDQFSQRIIARLLRPTVEYREAATPQGHVRAKCAILTLKDFEIGTSGGWFHSYLWGRFAQPAPLLYARDEGVKARVRMARARAIRTFLDQAQPMWPLRLRPFQAWCRGLALSYRSELRAEPLFRIRRIYRVDRAFYEEAFAAAKELLSWPLEPLREDSNGEQHYRLTKPNPAARRRGHWAWALRRIQGKILSILRLIKAAFTFQGGTDYILWKIACHSGRRLVARPWQRRHPLLAAPWLLWRFAIQKERGNPPPSSDSS